MAQMTKMFEHFSWALCLGFMMVVGNGRGPGNPGGSRVWVSLGAGVGHHESTHNLGLPTGM